MPKTTIAYFPNTLEEGGIDKQNPPERVIVGVSLNNTGLSGESLKAILELLHSSGVKEVQLVDSSYLHRHNIKAKYISITDDVNILSKSSKEGEEWRRLNKEIIEEFEKRQNFSIKFIQWRDLLDLSAFKKARKKIQEQFSSKAQFASDVTNTACTHISKMSEFEIKQFENISDRLCELSPAFDKQAFHYIMKSNAAVTKEERLDPLLRQINRKYLTQFKSLNEFKEHYQKALKQTAKLKDGAAQNILFSLLSNDKLQPIGLKIFSTPTQLAISEIELLETSSKAPESLKRVILDLDVYSYLLTEISRKIEIAYPGFKCAQLQDFLDNIPLDMDEQINLFAQINQPNGDSHLLDSLIEFAKDYSTKRSSFLDLLLETLSTIELDQTQIENVKSNLLFLYNQLDNEPTQLSSKSMSTRLLLKFLLTKPKKSHPLITLLASDAETVQKGAIEMAIPELELKGPTKNLIPSTFTVSQLEKSLIDALNLSDEELWYIRVLKGFLTQAKFTAILANLALQTSEFYSQSFMSLSGCVYFLIKESCDKIKPFLITKEDKLRLNQTELLAKQAKLQEAVDLQRKENTYFNHFYTAAESYLLEECCGIPFLCQKESCGHFFYPEDKLYDIVRQCLDPINMASLLSIPQEKIVQARPTTCFFSKSDTDTYLTKPVSCAGEHASTFNAVRRHSFFQPAEDRKASIASTTSMASTDELTSPTGTAGNESYLFVASLAQIASLFALTTDPEERDNQAKSLRVALDSFTHKKRKVKPQDSHRLQIREASHKKDAQNSLELTPLAGLEHREKATQSPKPETRSARR